MDPSKFSKAVRPLCSTTLDLPPSCIEFVPGFPEYFVVGTYNLQKDVDTGSAPQSRTGSLNLFRVADDELTLLQTLSHPSAILDLHFLPNSSKTFAVVSSTGTISIYAFEQDHISHLVTHQAFEVSLLILSFTWYPLHPTVSSQSLGPTLAVTLSNGAIHLLRFTPDFQQLIDLNDSIPINFHELEAWTCAFAVSQTGSGPVRIWSGGDDGKLRLVELESLPSGGEDAEVSIVQTIPQSVFRGHEAGVTAILPIPSDGLGDLLLTGSYDDHVRVYTAYDTRPGQKKTGKALAELKIGGGVWRLKFLDATEIRQSADGDIKFKVLASCMHAGARILEVKMTSGEWSIEILACVTVHESMNYGSDVQFAENVDPDTERLCISTSFYDRLVCAWRYYPNASQSLR